MTILVWIIIGGVAGWLASIVMGKNQKMGLVANVATCYIIASSHRRYMYGWGVY